MIQLTSNILAVEVPNDATDMELNEGAFLVFLSYKIGIQFYLKDLQLKPSNHSLIGVTPLSEEQAELIVEWVEEKQYYRDYRKDGWQGDIPAIQSFATLLESKGLDINKKYAIVKIEK